jgi:hypothetical protein
LAAITADRQVAGETLVTGARSKRRLLARALLVVIECAIHFEVEINGDGPGCAQDRCGSARLLLWMRMRARVPGHTDKFLSCMVYVNSLEQQEGCTKMKMLGWSKRGLAKAAEWSKGTSSIGLTRCVLNDVAHCSDSSI